MAALPVFVYGTLRPGESNWNLVADRIVGVTPARLDGYALYGRRMPFPYVAPRAGGVVQGDLLDVDPGRYDRVLGDLDRLEGYHGPTQTARNHYDRRVVTVSLATGGSRPAWVYIAGAAAVARFTEDHRIITGDWRHRQDAAAPGTGGARPGCRTDR